MSYDQQVYNSARWWEELNANPGVNPNDPSTWTPEMIRAHTENEALGAGGTQRNYNVEGYSSLIPRSNVNDVVMPEDQWRPDTGAGEQLLAPAEQAYQNQLAGEPYRAEDIYNTIPIEQRQYEQAIADAPAPILPKNLNPQFAADYPALTAYLGAATTPFRQAMETPFAQRAGQSGAEIMTTVDNRNKADTGSAFGNTAADLFGGLMGFVANPVGGAESAGAKLFGGAESAIERALPFIPGAAKLPEAIQTGIKIGGATIPYEAAIAKLNDREFSPGEAAKAGLSNAALAMLPYGIGRVLGGKRVPKTGEVKTERQISLVPEPLEQAPSNPAILQNATSTNDILRSKTGQMSPEEIHINLYRSPKTDMWNRRAYDEITSNPETRLPVQTLIDVDSLKWFNDNKEFGSHIAGDTMLKTVADSFKDAGLDSNSFHLSGDEFGAQFHTEADAHAALQKVSDIFRSKVMEFEDRSGRKRYYQGGGFSYGTGENLKTADTAMLADKAGREAAGLRSGSGQRPAGLVEVGTGGRRLEGGQGAVSRGSEENIGAITAGPEGPRSSLLPEQALPQGIGAKSAEIPAKQSPTGNPNEFVQSFPVSALEAPGVNRNVKDELYWDVQPGEKGTYQRRSHEMLQQRADALVAESPEAAYQFATSVETIKNEPDLTVAVGIKLADHYQKAGNTRAANEMLNVVADHLTRAGQTVNAAKLIQKLDPDGVVMRGQREAKKAFEELPAAKKQQAAQKTKQVEEAFKEIDKGAIDQIIDETPELGGAKKAPAEKPKGAKKPVEKKEPDPADMLAERIKQYVSTPKEGAEGEAADEAKKIVRTLFSKATEVLPKQPIPKTKVSELERVAEALNNSDKYRQVWEDAKGVLQEKYGETPQIMKDVEAYIEHWLNVPYAERSLDRILKGAIKDTGFDLEKSAFGPLSPTFEGGKESGRDLIRGIISESGLTGQTADTLAMELGSKLDEMVKGKFDAKTSQLAERIIKEATGTPGTAPSNPAKEIFDTLMQKAKETMPKVPAVGAKKDPMLAIFNSLNNRGTFNQVWSATKSQIAKNLEERGISVEGANLDRLFAELLYHPYSNAQLDRAVRGGIKDYGVDLGQLVREHFTKQEGVLQDLAEKLVTRGGLTRDEAAVLSQDVTKRLNEIASAKKQQILDQIFKQRGILPAKKTVDQKIIEWSNLGALSKQQYFNLVAEKLGLPTLTEDAAANLRNIAEKYQTTEGAAKEEWGWRLQAALEVLKTSSVGRKISTVQIIAQLLNPKTHVRNLLGNEMFYRLERATKYPAAAIDWGVSKLTGTPRTITTGTAGLGGYGEGLKKGAKASWMGANPEGIQSQFDIKGTAFNPEGNYLSRAASFLERLTGTALKAPDYAAYKRAYNNTIGEIATLRAMNQGIKGKGAIKNMALGIMKNADDIAHQTARKNGLYNTFQDENMASTAFVTLKRGLNINKEFGLGDILIKYPRTPGALLSRGLEYSPLGVIKSGLTLARPWISKNAEPVRAEVIESLTRAAVGTFGLTGMGYYLANVGIITGSSPKDKDVTQLEKQSGGGPYRLNWSALKRFVSSGFNSSVTGRRPGDKLISYDWMQPLAMAVSAGANIAQNIKGKKNATEGLGATLAGSFEGAINTLAEQPLIQGVTRFVQGYDMGENVTNTAKGIPASFMPTLGKQIAQSTDNTTRLTYDTSPIKESMNMVIAKLPGLSKKLPVAYDTLGKPKEAFQGGGNNVFNVFLNPAFVSKYDVTPAAELALRTFADTGETKQFPRVAAKSFKISGKSYELTPQEYSEFQRIIGEKTQQGFSKMRRTNRPEEQIKDMVKVLDEAGETGKMEILKARGHKVYKHSGNIVVK